MGKNDRLVHWNKDQSRRNNPWAAEHAALPATLAVRLVRFRVAVPGFRTEEVTLATTLLDAEAYPAAVLADLYRARWNIELRYSERVARSVLLHNAERIPRRRRSGKSRPRWAPTCCAAKARR